MTPENAPLKTAYRFYTGSPTRFQTDAGGKCWLRLAPRLPEGAPDYALGRGREDESGYLFSDQSVSQPATRRYEKRITLFAGLGDPDRRTLMGLMRARKDYMRLRSSRTGLGRFKSPLCTTVSLVALQGIQEDVPDTRENMTERMKVHEKVNRFLHRCCSGCSVAWKRVIEKWLRD